MSKSKFQSEKDKQQSILNCIGSITGNLSEAVISGFNPSISNKRNSQQSPSFNPLNNDIMKPLSQWRRDVGWGDETKKFEKIENQKPVSYETQKPLSLTDLPSASQIYGGPVAPTLLKNSDPEQDKDFVGPPSSLKDPEQDKDFVGPPSSSRRPGGAEDVAAGIVNNPRTVPFTPDFSGDAPPNINLSSGGNKTQPVAPAVPDSRKPNRGLSPYNDGDVPAVAPAYQSNEAQHQDMFAGTLQGRPETDKQNFLGTPDTTKPPELARLGYGASVRTPNASSPVNPTQKTKDDFNKYFKKPSSDIRPGSPAAPTINQNPPSVQDVWNRLLLPKKEKPVAPSNSVRLNDPYSQEIVTTEMDKANQTSDIRPGSPADTAAKILDKQNTIGTPDTTGASIAPVVTEPAKKQSSRYSQADTIGNNLWGNVEVNGKEVDTPFNNPRTVPFTPDFSGDAPPNINLSSGGNKTQPVAPSNSVRLNDPYSQEIVTTEMDKANQTSAVPTTASLGYGASVRTPPADTNGRPESVENVAAGIVNKQDTIGTPDTTGTTVFTSKTGDFVAKPQNNNPQTNPGFMTSAQGAPNAPSTSVPKLKTSKAATTKKPPTLFSNPSLSMSDQYAANRLSKDPELVQRQRVVDTENTRSKQEQIRNIDRDNSQLASDRQRGIPNSGQYRGTPGVGSLEASRRGRVGLDAIGAQPDNSPEAIEKRGKEIALIMKNRPVATNTNASDAWIAGENNTYKKDDLGNDLLSPDGKPIIDKMGRKEKAAQREIDYQENNLLKLQRRADLTNARNALEDAQNRKTSSGRNMSSASRGGGGGGGAGQPAATSKSAATKTESGNRFPGFSDEDMKNYNKDFSQEESPAATPEAPKSEARKSGKTMKSGTLIAELFDGDFLSNLKDAATAVGTFATPPDELLYTTGGVMGRAGFTKQGAENRSEYYQNILNFPVNKANAIAKGLPGGDTFLGKIGRNAAMGAVYPATKVAANMLTRMLYDPRSDPDSEATPETYSAYEKRKSEQASATTGNTPASSAPAATQKSGTSVSPGGTSTGHNPKTPGSTWVQAKSDTNPVFALVNKMKPKTQQIQWNPYKANFSQQNRAAAE